MKLLATGVQGLLRHSRPGAIAGRAWAAASDGKSLLRTPFPEQGGWVGRFPLTSQGFIHEHLLQNLFIDIFHMDHAGVVSKDELLVFLELLKRRDGGAGVRVSSWKRQLN